MNATWGPCKESQFTAVPFQVNYAYLDQQDSALLSAVSNIGPVPAAINVSTISPAIFFYSSGILDPTDPNIC